MDNTKLKSRMSGKVQELQQPVEVATGPDTSMAPASPSYLALTNNALDIIRVNLKSQPLTLDLFDIQNDTCENLESTPKLLPRTGLQK